MKNVANSLTNSVIGGLAGFGMLWLHYHTNLSGPKVVLIGFGCIFLSAIIREIMRSRKAKKAKVKS